MIFHWMINERIFRQSEGKLQLFIDLATAIWRPFVSLYTKGQSRDNIYERLKILQQALEFLFMKFDLRVYAYLRYQDLKIEVLMED